MASGFAHRQICRAESSVGGDIRRLSGCTGRNADFCLIGHTLGLRGGRRGSNPRPLAPQARALPTELLPPRSPNVPQPAQMPARGIGGGGAAGQVSRGPQTGALLRPNHPRGRATAGLAVADRLPAIGPKMNLITSGSAIRSHRLQGERGSLVPFLKSRGGRASPLARKCLAVSRFAGVYNQSCRGQARPVCGLRVKKRPLRPRSPGRQRRENACPTCTDEYRFDVNPPRGDPAVNLPRRQAGATRRLALRALLVPAPKQRPMSADFLLSARDAEGRTN